METGIYLKDLHKTEIVELYETNESFKNKVWEEAYNNNMELQQQEFIDIFGSDNRTYTFHNHYSSFYLRVTEPDKFIESINKEYLSEDNLKIYQKAKNKLTEYWLCDLEEEDEKASLLYDEVEDLANELCEGIENQLHGYETVEDYDCDAVLDDIINGCSGLSEFTTSQNVVYETHITVYK